MHTARKHAYTILFHGTKFNTTVFMRTSMRCSSSLTCSQWRWVSSCCWTPPLIKTLHSCHSKKTTLRETIRERGGAQRGSFIVCVCNLKKKKEKIGCIFQLSSPYITFYSPKPIQSALPFFALCAPLPR
jgi:hypothetical protein